MTEAREAIVLVIGMILAFWISLGMWLWLKPSGRKTLDCKFSLFGSTIDIAVTDSEGGRICRHSRECKQFVSSHEKERSQTT